MYEFLETYFLNNGGKEQAMTILKEKISSLYKENNNIAIVYGFIMGLTRARIVYDGNYLTFIKDFLNPAMFEVFGEEFLKIRIEG